LRRVRRGNDGDLQFLDHKDVRLQCRRRSKVVISGQKPDNVTAKDFMLEVLRHPYVKQAGLGSWWSIVAMLSSLSVDERATMTNMTAEVGGSRVRRPDAKTVEYLMDYRKMSRAEAERLGAGSRAIRRPSTAKSSRSTRRAFGR